MFIIHEWAFSEAHNLDQRTASADAAFSRSKAVLRSRDIIKAKLELFVKLYKPSNSGTLPSLIRESGAPTSPLFGSSLTMYASAPAQSSEIDSLSALFFASSAVEYSNCLSTFRLACPSLPVGFFHICLTNIVDFCIVYT